MKTVVEQNIGGCMNYLIKPTGMSNSEHACVDGVLEAVQ